MIRNAGRTGPQVSGICVLQSQHEPTKVGATWGDDERPADA
jgi:hypothetical protein